MDEVLPKDIAQGATLRGNEYGWSVSIFPVALERAVAYGYACLGGQFQFRLDDGTTCEMHWLVAESVERADGECWTDYSRRSCSEVLEKFRHLVSATDFDKEAASWPGQVDSKASLVFVAYFVLEAEWGSLSTRNQH
jgi:hypothetical protein